jgi:predicted transcriptional regulator
MIERENGMSSKKRKVDKEKLKPIYALRKERGLIINELKARGPLTIPELSEATGLEAHKVLRYLIALRQFGKVDIVEEKDDQLVYALKHQ